MPGVPIVVGIDGSAASPAVLRHAACLGERLGCGVDAVIAWEPPAHFGWPLALPGLSWDAAGWARTRLEETAEQAFPAGRPAALRLRVQQGHPAAVLIAAGNHAQLLVLGRRGLGALGGFLLGSVSAACIAHARCPVLVLPDPDSEGRPS